MSINAEISDCPDPHQGHAREWPSTPYSDEARAAEPPMEFASVIALLGDCTVACTYLPPANRPENHLAVRLRRAFPGQPFVVRNLAADGESAADFLASGRMDDLLARLPRLDFAFIRYRINDRKQVGIAGCITSLRALCDALRDRFPAVTVILETGIWVDYPAHYLWDRNARLAPLYGAVRELAKASGHGLVDIFEGMAAEAATGNWDLRVRGLPDPAHLIVDDSLDRFFGHDPAFFTNIHPNSRCLGLIADWEIEALRPYMPAS
ncbi:MAG: GDSL-type esterase/lipase family protein [Chloroflexi bacterium]|nr:GDSL-type esterase/lipase family protein [Chloroflexota bacterium]